ncbi:early endosome antigen 1-like [Pollicipes pollicipes]|uniref:early endosome antigen 1-like n=1 Tax=Pollicipes pollicipes TaxID=41117 RepID=UPI0018856702|nr:early endosome antigen 1-like [Pollicipes pollicipes]
MFNIKNIVKNITDRYRRRADRKAQERVAQEVDRFRKDELKKIQKREYQRYKSKLEMLRQEMQEKYEMELESAKRRLDVERDGLIAGLDLERQRRAPALLEENTRYRVALERQRVVLESLAERSAELEVQMRVAAGGRPAGHPRTWSEPADPGAAASRDARIEEVEGGRTASVSSAEDASAAVGGAEGFLCPTCMKGFATPEQLQQHDQTAHIDPSATYLCPVCKARLTSSAELEQHFARNHPPLPQSDDVEVLQHELTDVNTTLREERWYSEELKREVARLQQLVEATQSEETMLYQEQIKALQESKALVTSEVMLLRKQLTEALESSTALKQDYKTLQEKVKGIEGEQEAGSYAAEKAALSAAADDAQGRVDMLEAQLQLKNSTDDAALLRQELVQEKYSQLQTERQAQTRQIPSMEEVER